MPPLRTFLTWAIAMVWLVNGLFCKVLNLVPRHQQIVANILGNDIAPIATKAIGMAEIAIAIWIVSGIKPRICAILQIVVVATMNVIEFYRVPHLLLFGKWNPVVAFLFVVVIFIHEFASVDKTSPK